MNKISPRLTESVHWGIHVKHDCKLYYNNINNTDVKDEREVIRLLLG